MDEFVPAPVVPEDAWQDAGQNGEVPPQPVQEGAAPKKRRGRPPGSGTRTGVRRTRSRKSLRDQIGGTLELLNLAFAFMPDPWRGDALDQDEIIGLAEALDAVAQADPTVHRMLSVVLTDGGSYTQLIFVAAIITGRRLARHGIIDAEYDTRLQAYIARNVTST